MIILLSIGFERSTDEIIDYLIFNKAKFIRLNSDEIKNNSSFNFYYNLNDDNTFITINNHHLNLNEKKIIWHRRISTRTNIDKYLDSKMDFDNSRKLTQFIFKDWDVFLHILVDKLSTNTIWFDYPFFKKNKIEVLNVAKKWGLKIPETIITNNVQLISENEYITKPLDGPIGIQYGNFFYVTYTTLIKKIQNKILPSLIQKKINKKYEIRTYYLDGECYSMAIFSQNDKQTQIDFREYNYNKPNRNIPYKLPLEIEEKLKKMMDVFQLKTGSIDIIKGIDGEYYFLEVNPVGQFGMTSKPCNYNLEKITYNKIIEYDKSFK